MKAHNDYILHLASWYPTHECHTHAIFVKDQISTISEHILPGVVYSVVESDKIKNKKVSAHKSSSLVEYQMTIPRRKHVFRLWTYFMAYCHVRRIIAKHGKPKYIHCHVMFPIISLATLLQIILSVPLFVTENFTVFDQNSTQRYKGFIIKFCRFFSSRARKIQCVSNNLENQLTRFGFNESKLIKIPNLVDQDNFHYRPRRPNAPLQFLHVSTLANDAKNPIGMLDALKLLDDKGNEVDFTIICNKEYNLQNTINYALDLGLYEKINFHKSISHEEMGAFMSNYDVFVLFSNFENMPCVLLEAQCCGLYIISTTIGGPVEIVTDLSLGTLVPSRDYEALANEIEKLVCESVVIDRKHISHKGINRYGTDSYLNSMHHLYSI